MQIVPRLLLSPLLASFWIGARCPSVFSLIASSMPPPWIMKPGMTRWKIRPSKKPASTYLRKFSTVIGALARSSSRVIGPAVVSRTTTGLSSDSPCAASAIESMESPKNAASPRQR